MDNIDNKVVPLHPEAGQEAPQQVTQAPQEAPQPPPLREGALLATVDQFAHLVERWHADKLMLAEHLAEIPEGTEVSVLLAGTEDQPEPDTKTFKLEGDALDAFRIGVVSVMHHFAVLPFSHKPMPVPGESEPAANQQAKDPADDQPG